ncbi:MAG TPA: hypothetical protein PK557_07385 [Paludibacteraceae bacterium]|nr:hypothetical protein [Paludibacteraceae bacterium]
MMTYHSNIKAGDIFHARYLNYKGTEKRHYFYCIYAQADDPNNTLTEDIIGLMISSNTKFERLEEQGVNDYNVQVEIFGKKSWVCVDKSFRFMLSDSTCEIDKKKISLTEKEKSEILNKYSRFYLEATRQMIANEK